MSTAAWAEAEFSAEEIRREGVLADAALLKQVAQAADPLAQVRDNHARGHAGGDRSAAIRERSAMEVTKSGNLGDDVRLMSVIRAEGAPGESRLVEAAVEMGIGDGVAAVLVTDRYEQGMWLERRCDEINW